MYLDMRKTSVGSALKQMALQDISKEGEESAFTRITAKNETVLSVLISKCNNLYDIILRFQQNEQTVKDNPFAQAAMIESFSLIHMLRQLVTQQEMILNFAFEEEIDGGKKQVKKIEKSYESLISQNLITATKQGIFLRDTIKKLEGDTLTQKISNKFYDIQNAESISTIEAHQVWEKIQTLTWFDLEDKKGEKNKIKWITNNKGRKKFEEQDNDNLIITKTVSEKDGKTTFWQRSYDGLAFNNGWLWEWFSEMVIKNQQLLAEIFYAPDGMALSLFFNADEVERDTLEGWKGGDYQGNTERQQYQAKYENQKLMSIKSILTVLNQLKDALKNIANKNSQIKKQGTKELLDIFLSSNITEHYLSSSSAHLQKVLRGLNRKITNINIKFQ